MDEGGSAACAAPTEVSGAWLAGSRGQGWIQ